MSVYRHLGWIIFAPCFMGCGDVDGGSAEESGPLLQTRSAALVAPPSSKDVCSSHRWVGVTLTGQCPGSMPVPGAGVWQQSWLTGSAPSTAPGLAKLCAYEWAPSSIATADPEPRVHFLPSDAGRPAMDWLSRDCQVTGPLGGILPAEFGVDLNGQLLRQVDAPLHCKSNPAMVPARVQVAVLDTAPDSGQGPLIPGRNGHGYALARMIENVTCPRVPDGSATGTCLGKPEAVLALPHTGPDQIDPKEGGHSGTPWQLAVALTRTVNDFIERASSDDKDPPRRLIINLSLGWEPRWGGEFTSSPDELEGPIRAVYDALMHASCHGALVVAAAGNAPGGPDPVQGAMFPARWETVLAPSLAQCVAFEGNTSTMMSLPEPPFPDAGYRPLVHAVGGVDGADNVLRNARPNSLPRITAPAALAAGVVPKGTRVGHPGGGWRLASAPESTRLLTGSSVGAALVSSGAATIWAFRPELKASEVMQVLVDTGAELHRPPKHEVKTSTCLGGLPCSTSPRRLSICKAFEKVCSGGASRCPSVLPSCAAPIPYSGKVSRPGPAAMAALQASFSPFLRFDGSSCSQAAETPDTQWFGTQVAPRLAPQPGDHICPACHAQFNPRAALAEVFISIDPTSRSEVSSPALLVYTGSSATPFAVDLSDALPDRLVPGVRYYVDDVPVRLSFTALQNITSARVSFLVANDPAARTRGSLSVTEEIPFFFR